MNPIFQLVDDSDRKINYGPGWVSKKSPLPSTDLNYPMFGSLHQTSSESELTYSFTGSFIQVCLQMSTDDIGMPVSRVLIDDLSINASSILNIVGDTGVVQNCIQVSSGLSEGQHGLLLSANATQDQPISFDYLIFTPSSPVSIASFLLRPDNPAFKYGGDWKPNDANQNIMETTTVNSTFTFDFYGVSLLWFGFINTTGTASPSLTLASFAVDGDQRTVELNDFTPSSLSNTEEVEIFVSESLIFQSDVYPRGQHRLEVVYLGDNSTEMPVPLAFTSLVIKNGTTSPNVSLTSSSTPSKPTGPSAISDVVKGGHLPVILGCSGAAILALLIIAIFCARRKRQKRKYSHPESGTARSIEPFQHYPVSTPVDPHHKGQCLLQEQGQLEDTLTEVDSPPSYTTGPHTLG